jgi:membrane protein
LAIGSVVALPIALKVIGLGSFTDALLRIGRWPLLILMMLFGLAVLYRFAPSRRMPQ